MENGSERTWGRLLLVLYRSGRSSSKCSVDVVCRGGIRSSNSGKLRDVVLGSEESSTGSYERRERRRTTTKVAAAAAGHERRRRRQGSSTRTGRGLVRCVRRVPRLGTLLQHTQPDGPTPRPSKHCGETPAGRNGPYRTAITSTTHCCATDETFVIIVFPTFYDHLPINPPKSFDDEERYRRRALAQPRAYNEHDDSQQCTVVLYGRAESKRSKGMARDVMRPQADLGREGGDAAEEVEGKEGDDDERAEKKVSATLLPPGLTASQSTEDDDEEEEDEEEDDEDEADGASRRVQRHLPLRLTLRIIPSHPPTLKAKDALHIHHHTFQDD